MKISTKTRYGTRFLLHLAQHGTSAPITLSGIAKAQEISFKYLWNIASVLKSAGIVKTVVGAGGGFKLAKSPEQITLYDVFSAFDGELKLVHCIRNAAACRRSPTCTARDVWSEMNASLEKSLRSVTIAEMVRRDSAKAAIKRRKRG
ncbi:MAG: Rrf2 family transcriptional regulator [Elusimicrobiales bacterium]|nr:Rrf2 family transcriptional regulator [Elusimicrobiales bacterium]